MSKYIISHPDWEPMDTAPRDGTVIYGADFTDRYFVTWDDAYQRWVRPDEEGAPAPFVCSWRPIFDLPYPANDLEEN